ncbi:MAG: symmetrical bis(5'-nucleosyl)-tetraphosphatase [Cardiobacteriaceae bacterium]|nr:symmetrical bis(5'-nucleosyl)-tetraphosphatase [Cardiobacteriaceae bacterium]
MTAYAIGDVHAHLDQLLQLLDAIKYDRNQDELWFVGDFINRGEQSLETLRFVMELGSSAKTVIGNHDFSLMVQGFGLDKGRVKKTVAQILKEKDAGKIVDWLCQMPLAVEDERRKIMMTHAGVYPFWSRKELNELNCQYQNAMQGKKSDKKDFLQAVYRNGKGIWKKDGKFLEKMCFTVNACTRMRYLNPDHSLDFDAKMPPAERNPKLACWFDKFAEKMDKDWQDWKIVFGHWAALGIYIKPQYACIDGGAAWGGKLVAFDLDHWQIAAEIAC